MRRLHDDLCTVIAVGALALCATVGGSGCGVRSTTICATYDRALSRVDPNTLVQRDSAGASVCVETGPRE